MSKQRHTLQIEDINLPISRSIAIDIADAITSRLSRNLTPREFVALMDNIDNNNPEFTMQFDGIEFQFIVKNARIFKVIYSPATTEGE